MNDYENNFVSIWENNLEYFDMLCLMASLSKLYSENSIPYLDYRSAENLFCKYYGATNDARSCTAYDARLGSLGIGIKTFGISSGHSTEKIAEFNKLRPILNKYKGDELAIKIAEFRNDRIDVSDNMYDISNSIYHIVGRQEFGLVVFNTPYERIPIDEIRNINDTEKSISFEAHDEKYVFNKSKSVLLKRFDIAQEFKKLSVDILEDPLSVLSRLLNNIDNDAQNHLPSGNPTHILKPHIPKIKGVDYVIPKFRIAEC